MGQAAQRPSTTASRARPRPLALTIPSSMYFTVGRAGLGTEKQALHSLHVEHLFNDFPLVRAIQRPCGLMDKALVFGTKDCRFQSCQGHARFKRRHKAQPARGHTQHGTLWNSGPSSNMLPLLA